jgi:hypothetical protein
MFFTTVPHTIGHIEPRWLAESPVSLDKGDRELQNSNIGHIASFDTGIEP